MPTVRLRDDDSSAGSAIATVLIGAVAGFAVGVYLAQRVGGFSGIAGKLRRAKADLEASYYAAAGEDFLDDEADEEDFDWDGDEDDSEIEEPAADSPLLEERVLEAFNNDPVLSERAIDIGAVGDGEIELEG